MRIVDPYYLITYSIIICGLCILLYRKYLMEEPTPLNVTIYGSTIEAGILAYYLHKDQRMNLNITIIGQFKPDFLEILQKYQQQLPHLPLSKYIDRRMIQFCGDEPLLMSFLEQMHMQYKIKQSEIIFSKEAQTHVQGFASSLYRLIPEENILNSMLKIANNLLDYGMSHMTAFSLWSEFEYHLMNNIQYENMMEKSMRGILNRVMPWPQMATANGMEFISQDIGLDQKYVRDFLGPIIKGTYMQNVNSVAMMLKILPLYCNNLSNHHLQNKHLSLPLDERTLFLKLLLQLKYSSQFTLLNATITEFQQFPSNTDVNFTILRNNTLEQHNTNMLFILEDYANNNEKLIPYYRTIVDGVIQGDQQYEELFTIYFQGGEKILSITRLCSADCRNFRNYVYMIVSVSKLTENDLSMFVDHQIMAFKKFYAIKETFPSAFLKFQQTTNIYRISDTEAISDNYELKLIIMKNLVNIVHNYYKQVQK